MCGVALWGVSAQASFYADLGAGVRLNDGSVTTGSIKNKFKNSPIYVAQVGHELPLPMLDVRLEGEYLHFSPDVKEGKNRHFDGLMANAFADIPFVPVVDPYVGVGAGYVCYDHNNSVALQGMAGIEYKLPVIPLTIGGKYRYLTVNEQSATFDSLSKLHTNIFILKAQYSF